MAFLSVSYEVFPAPAKEADEGQLVQHERTSLWTVSTPAPLRRHNIVYIAERMSIREAKTHCHRILEKSERKLHPACEIVITGFSVLPDEINADS